MLIHIGYVPMKNKSVLYCITSSQYIIVDKQLDERSIYDLDKVMVFRRKCRCGKLIKKNLTEKEAYNFVLTMNKLKGK